jgi:hypothetical protein
MRGIANFCLEAADRLCTRRPASFVRGRNQLSARVYLFSKDLFHVANFPLHFTADLFCGPAVLQVLVPDRFAGFLFDFADSLFRRTFCFIVCA